MTPNDLWFALAAILGFGTLLSAASFVLAIVPALLLRISRLDRIWPMFALVPVHLLMLLVMLILVVAYMSVGALMFVIAATFVFVPWYRITKARRARLTVADHA